MLEKMSRCRWALRFSAYPLKTIVTNQSVFLSYYCHPMVMEYIPYTTIQMKPTCFKLFCHVFPYTKERANQCRWYNELELITIILEYMIFTKSN